jgi:hypothetical protein
MFGVTARLPCPLCKVPSSVKHCKGGKCGWYVCYDCSSLINSSVAFNSKSRFFKQEKVK